MRFAIVIISLVTFFLPAGAQEYRASVSAEFDILPRLQGEVEIELRKIFYPRSYFNRTFQGELSYEINSLWSIGAMYNFAIVDEDREFEDEDDGETGDRNKWVVDLTFQPRRFESDLRLSNRFRYQYTIVDDDDPKLYLRNKLTLDYKITGKMNPYIAVEPYLRFDSNKIKIIRIYLGNEMPFFSTKIDLYYIVEISPDRESTTTSQYIVGVAFELDFKK